MPLKPHCVSASAYSQQGGGKLEKVNMKLEEKASHPPKQKKGVTSASFSPQPIQLPSPTKSPESIIPTPMLSSKATPPTPHNPTSATCKFCGRPIPPERIELHQEMCSKIPNNKRITFMAKLGVKRVDGDGDEEGGNEEEAFPKGNWHKEHDKFIDHLGQTKQIVDAYVTGNIPGIPAPPEEDELSLDFVQCNNCLRRFHKEFAAKHIPLCVKMIYNQPKVKNRFSFSVRSS